MLTIDCQAFAQTVQIFQTPSSSLSSHKKSNKKRSKRSSSNKKAKKEEKDNETKIKEEKVNETKNKKEEDNSSYALLLQHVTHKIPHKVALINNN
jgi:negative regulator of genetic competence, sporulation and motility